MVYTNGYTTAIKKTARNSVLITLHTVSALHRIDFARMLPNAFLTDALGKPIRRPDQHKTHDSLEQPDRGREAILAL